MSGYALSELTAQVITPAEAQRLLLLTREAGCRLDPVDMDHVRLLARDMACGDWNDANPVPLALCSHGAVIRGVHRLHAMVISQMPRRFLIARDVPHRVRYVASSKARTAADALGAIGVASHRKEIAAGVQLVHLYETERNILPWAAWERRIFTNAETVRLLRTRYPDLPLSVPTMTALRSGLSSRPPASLAAAYLITRAASGLASAAADFFQGLIFPSRFEPSDPRHALHTWFKTRAAAPRGRVTSTHQVGLIITCWNAWTQGAVWSETLFGPGDPMPDIYRIAAIAPDA